jgi:hypothetical protein
MGPWRLLTFFFCYTRKKKNVPRPYWAWPPLYPPSVFEQFYWSFFSSSSSFWWQTSKTPAQVPTITTCLAFIFLPLLLAPFLLVAPLNSLLLASYSWPPPQANGIRTRRRRRRRRRENGGQKARLVTRSHSLVGSGDWENRPNGIKKYKMLKKIKGGQIVFE